MSQQQILSCLVSDTVDLDKEWSREDVTTNRIIQLLIEHNDEFNAVRKNWAVERVSFLAFTNIIFPLF
jgi:hypothetical protein